MNLNFIDKIGDWNPQLLKEIKPRLKNSNIIIALSIYVVGEFMLLKYFQFYVDILTSKFDIQKLFINISLTTIFVMLVAGTYMLINDIAKEEILGTLNLIRLSPQSSPNILIGKMLGIPILLYLLVIFIIIPVHLYVGIAGHIPLLLILSYYIFEIAICFFFYSVALLFALLGFGYNYRGFQPWLGSGVVIIFLLITSNTLIMNSTLDWLNLFSPSLMLSYFNLINNPYDLYIRDNLESLQWFYLPFGKNIFTMMILVLANYGVCTYWIWQALERRFHNPTKTILSKGQSYALVVCFEVINLGFTLQTSKSDYILKQHIAHNGIFLVIFNLCLFFGLMLILSPHRQVLQDWARYRRQKVSESKKFWNRSLIKDLIWGEKSPSVLSIAVNLLIATAIFLPVILVAPIQSIAKIILVICIGFFILFIMVYASLIQLTLIIKPFQKWLWASLTIGITICLPIICQILLLTYDKQSNFWLASILNWIGTENGIAITILLSIVAQLSLLTLLNLQLKKQLQKAGESTTKVLLDGRNSLPTG